MTTLSDLQAVLRFACNTEDRSNAEQLALLRLARRADAAANLRTTDNPNYDYERGEIREVSNLEQLVDESRVISDYPADRQRVVSLPRTKLEVVR